MDVILIFGEDGQNGGIPSIWEPSILNKLGKHSGCHGLCAGAHMNLVTRGHLRVIVPFADSSRSRGYNSIFINPCGHNSRCLIPVTNLGPDVLVKLLLKFPIGVRIRGVSHGAHRQSLQS